MGDFMLSCLLGQYDRAQSFDVDSHAPVTQVQSWSKWDQTSWYFTSSLSPTQVHSSTQGLRIEVFSSAGSASVLAYDHGTPDDAYARWFPEVDTHTVEATAWMLLDPITSSGDLHFEIQAALDVELPLVGRSQGTDSLAFHQLSTLTYSGTATAPRVGVRIPSGSPVHSAATLLLDDVLTSVDHQTLHPEWSFRERARLIRSQYRLPSGNLHTLVWDKYFAFNLPLNFITNSQAAVLNWWWEGQLDLLFTLDSSDSESRYVVRVVNESQPVGQRIRPYSDLWRGNLELESVNRGGLAI